MMLCPFRAALREIEDCTSGNSNLEDDQNELQNLQAQLASKSAEMSAAMEESRRQLQNLTSSNPTSTSASVQPHSATEAPHTDKRWGSDTASLLRELVQLVEADSDSSRFSSTVAPQPADELHSQDADNEDEFDDWYNSSLPCTALLDLSILRRREPKSARYKTWVDERAQKVSDLAKYRDRRAVRNAQNSMQAFQQALVVVRRDQQSKAPTTGSELR